MYLGTSLNNKCQSRNVLGSNPIENILEEAKRVLSSNFNCLWARICEMHEQGEQDKVYFWFASAAAAAAARFLRSLWIGATTSEQRASPKTWTLLNSVLGKERPSVTPQDYFYGSTKHLAQFTEYQRLQSNIIDEWDRSNNAARFYQTSSNLKTKFCLLINVPDW